MSVDQPVTLKDIAKAAGVSVMTVSRALRNQPNLAPATRQRIQACARELGYRPNPLVSALMASRRSGRASKYHPILAYITNFPTRHGWRDKRIIQEFFQGAAAGADQHGFQLEEFWLREAGMTARRLSDVLFNRNIRGLLIAPLPLAHGHVDLDWARFSAVALGYSLAQPMLHRAVNHQSRSMRLAWHQAKQHDYRRVGLALPSSIDERVDHHWVGSFLGEQRFKPVRDQVPLLVVRDKDWNEATFAAWFQKHQPDVIISQQEEILLWLAHLGVRVPDDAGFLHLNCPDQSGRFAGIYQNGPTVGRTAVEHLINLVLRCECGVPALPHSILVDGTWQDGATLK